MHYGTRHSEPSCNTKTQPPGTDWRSGRWRGPLSPRMMARVQRAGVHRIALFLQEDLGGRRGIEVRCGKTNVLAPWQPSRFINSVQQKAEEEIGWQKVLKSVLSGSLILPTALLFQGCCSPNKKAILIQKNFSLHDTSTRYSGCLLQNWNPGFFAYIEQPP